jgi:ABC-type bacteriocin/lantibiotic exporter with double-glycine peptidase domain
MHFHKLKADPDQIAREFATNGKVFDTLDIVFTGKHLGLKIRAVKPKLKRLAKLPCPFIAETKDQKSFLVLAIQEDGGVILQAPPGRTL